MLDKKTPMFLTIFQFINLPIHYFIGINIVLEFYHKNSQKAIKKRRQEKGDRLLFFKGFFVRGKWLFNKVACPLFYFFFI